MKLYEKSVLKRVVPSGVSAGPVVVKRDKAINSPEGFSLTHS